MGQKILMSQQLAPSKNVEFNDLDWNYIAGKHLSNKEKHIDSNIVTPEEYQQILKVINKSKLTPYTKSWMSLFIIIGYRFGLRISEIHHLRFEDIQSYNNKIVIQVQKTSEGKTKSKKSVRQIPILGTLYDGENSKEDEENKISEKVVIDNYLNIVKQTPDFSVKHFLFTDPQNESLLLDRNIIWQNIHTLLRHIVGDSRIRFHHLRHSYLSGQFLGNFQNNAFRMPLEIKGNKWSKYNYSILNTLVSPDVYPAYSLASLSASAGHSKINTTVHSYIHLADELATGFSEKVPLPQISLPHLSKMTGYSVSTIKNRARKYKLSLKEYSAHKILKTIQMGDSLDAYPQNADKWLQKCPIKTSYRTALLSDIDNILRDYSFNNIVSIFINKDLIFVMSLLYLVIF